MIVNTSMVVTLMVDKNTRDMPSMKSCLENAKIVARNQSEMVENQSASQLNRQIFKGKRDVHLVW